MTEIWLQTYPKGYEVMPQTHGKLTYQPGSSVPSGGTRIGTTVNSFGV